MSENDLMAKLREMEFLEGVSDEHLQRLIDVARPVEFAEDAVIYREGDPASEVYLIVSGAVSVEICAPGVGCRRILTLNSGDLLGWSAILEQSRLTATARAMTPVEAIEFNGRQILALCEHDARFGYAFMRRAALAIARRLSATRVQLLDVFGSLALPAAAESQTDRPGGSSK